MKKFDRFILFPWGMISREGERAEKMLQGIKDCGFNASCFVPQSQFSTCRKLGLEIYASLEKDIVKQERSLAHEAILLSPSSSAKDVYEDIKKRLENMPKDVRAIYLTDEPGAGLFPKIKEWIACVRECTPWAEAYVNLFPNYAVCGAPNLSQLEAETYEEYLERFALEAKPDAISFDNYQVIIADNFKTAGGRESYFNNMLQARAVCDKYDLPFQFIACCNQLRPWHTIPTFANLAFQAYTAIAAGARVLSWFLYFSRGRYLYSPVDDMTGEDLITPTWYLLREINRRILPLGEVLFDMQYNGMYFTDTKGIIGGKSIKDCAAIKKFRAEEECVVGHYTDKDGKDAFLVVNCSMQNSVKVDMETKGATEFYDERERCWRKLMLCNLRGEISPLLLEPGCGILLR